MVALKHLLNNLTRAAMNPYRDDRPHRMTMTCEIKQNKMNNLDQTKKSIKGICEQLRERQQNSKRFTSIMVLLLMASTGWAQDQSSGSSTFWSDPFNHPLFPLYLVSVLVLVTVILVLITAAFALRILNLFIERAAKERAEKLGLAYVKEISFWEKTWLRWNSLRPLSEEEDLDMGHDYDGIRELDNHLPPWWKLLFYGTIVWGAFYLVAFHIIGSLPLSSQEYENEVALADQKAKAFLASQPTAAIDENALVYAKDDAILSKGKLVFSGSCVPCHRNDGGGNAIGPNITDAYWLHGGDIKSIYSTIKNGVVEKGMPMWGKAMSPSDVKAVAFYVMSLQGTNPANAKAPQGALYKPVDSQVKDSTAVKLDTVKIQALAK
jgi:cytochrome c oxidase cbb3-type subunit III